MDPETQRRVMVDLLPFAVLGSATAAQAVAVLQADNATIGERVNLDWAFRRLNGEA